MKRLLVVAAILVLGGCATESENVMLPPPEGLPQASVAQPTRPSPEVKHGFQIAELQSQLGLSRSPQSLGYEAKSFDGCQYGVHEDDGRCGRRYLTVVHFRLLCRDSVETVQSIATNFTPLVADHMQWRLGGVQGKTQTDSQGFGQVLVISPHPTKGQRFMLIIGTRSLGVEAGEVSQIIVPGNWCSEVAMSGGLDLPALAQLFNLPTN